MLTKELALWPINTPKMIIFVLLNKKCCLCYIIYFIYS